MMYGITMLTFILFLLYAGKTHTLECLHCNDALLNSSSVSSGVALLFRAFESIYRTPACADAQQAAAASSITSNTCTDDPKAGQVNRCGRLVGTVKVSVDPPLIGRVEVPIHLHIRGCFIVPQFTRGGCYTDKTLIDEQRGILSNLFKALNIANLGDFNGRLCVNAINNENYSDGATTIAFKIWWIVFYVILYVFLLG